MSRKKIANAPTAAHVAAASQNLGRELTPVQARGLAEYLGLLAKWNRVMNLVGPSRWRDVLGGLAADSWHLADFLSGLSLPDSPRTLDLGAGAGLPGIPLRLFWGAGEYLLVEPRQKRAAFMQQALAVTGIGSTSVAACRIENLPAEHLPADLVLGRAFKPWPEYLALARDLLVPDGVCVVMSNQPPPDAALIPPDWEPGQSTAYPSPGGERYFWSFTPVSMDR